jgi:hypothetical protein
MEQGVKRGDFVEFTDFHHKSYPPADMSLVRFGVCVEPGDWSNPVRVRLADGREVFANYIQSYAWSGWAPEGLEEVQEAIRCEDNPNDTSWWEDEAAYL